MEGHDSVSRSTILAPDLPQREEATDQGPVGMNGAPPGAEEEAAPVRPVAQDTSFFFRASPVELGRCDPEMAGETEGLVGRYRDGLVIAAGAARLALERERTLLLQVEEEWPGDSVVIHFKRAGILHQESGGCQTARTEPRLLGIRAKIRAES